MANFRDTQREKTKEKVIVSADKLFRSRGFSNTTIRDIASDCALSIGTVMSVGDKAALLVSSFDRHITKIHQNRESQQVIPRTPVSDVDRITSLFDPFIELFSIDFELSRSYGSILVMGTIESSVFNKLAAILIEEINLVLNKDDAHLANAIYRAYLGLLYSWPPTNTDKSELKQELRQLVSAICKGA